MTAHAAIKNTFFEDFFVQKSLTIITSGGTTNLDGSVKSLIPSLSETTVVKEGKVLNGEWTKEELADWAKDL